MQAQASRPCCQLSQPCRAGPELVTLHHPCPAGVPVVQVDPVFEGKGGGADSLVKFNPLCDVSSAEVWNFLRIMVSLSLSCCLVIRS